MAGVILVSPRQQFFDASGNPLSGGSVTVYLAGTTTASNTWQDRALTTLNTNPVVLDASGVCEIWGDSSLTYKWLIKDSAGVTIDTVDNVRGASDADELASAVATVAAISADITAVAAIDTDVTAVAAIDSEVTQTAAIAASVGTVATNIADINTVADNIADINALIADVQSASNLNAQFLTDDGAAYWHWWKPLDATTKGVWADAAAPNSVYTDTAGTTLAGNGDTVGMWRLNYDGLQDYANLTGYSFNNPTLTNWTKNRMTAGGTAGAATLVPTAVAGTHTISRTLTKVVGVNYRAKAKLGPSGYTKVRVEFSVGNYVDVEMAGAGSVLGSAGVTSPAVVADGSNYIITAEFVAASTSEAASLYVLNAAGSTSFTGDGVSGITFAYYKVEKLVRDHLVQSDSAKAYTYVEEGDLKFLRSTGVDEFMSAADIDFSDCSKVTIVVAMRQKDFSTTGGIVLEHGTNFTQLGFGVTVNNAVSGAFGGGMASAASNARVNNGPTASAERVMVGVAIFDPNAATNDDKVRIIIDGVDVDETNTTATGTTTVAAFTTLALYMGARAGTGSFHEHDIMGFGIYGKELSAAEIAGITSTGSLRIGNVDTATAAYSITPVAFSDCGATTTQANYIETAPFASVEVMTAATEIDVTGYCTIFAIASGQFAKIGVYVNGVYNQSITFTADTSQTHSITLSSGDKLVTFVNSAQSSPTGVNPYGVFIKSIAANRAMQQVFIPRRRIVVFGDSIANGDDADPVMQYAWPLQLRAAGHPASVALKGWGSASLYQFANTATLRKAFVKDLLAFKPDMVVLSIGTNDYGLDEWSAADFGTAYGASLDDLHSQAPWLPVMCQTPLSRSSEGANAFGDTLTAYRTQISSAVSARSTWAVPPTLIDGTAILTTASLSDGVHPTTAGHTLIADYYKANVLLWA